MQRAFERITATLTAAFFEDSAVLLGRGVSEAEVEPATWNLIEMGRIVLESSMLATSKKFARSRATSRATRTNLMHCSPRCYPRPHRHPELAVHASRIQRSAGRMCSAILSSVSHSTLLANLRLPFRYTAPPRIFRWACSSWRGWVMKRPCCASPANWNSCSLGATRGRRDVEAGAGVRRISGVCNSRSS